MADVPPLWGVNRFRVHVERLGVLDVAFAGPLERRLDTPPTLVLRRLLGTDHTLYDWYERAAKSPGDPRDVGVCQLAENDAVLNCWIARQAQPIAWRGPTFDGLALEVAQEEVELTYTRLDWPRNHSRITLFRSTVDS